MHETIESTNSNPQPPQSGSKMCTPLVIAQTHPYPPYFFSLYFPLAMFDFMQYKLLKDFEKSTLLNSFDFIWWHGWEKERGSKVDVGVAKVYDEVSAPDGQPPRQQGNSVYIYNSKDIPRRPTIN